MTVQRRHGKITAVNCKMVSSNGNGGLSSADPILGPAVRIKREWVKKAISKMKRANIGFLVGLLLIL